MPDRLTSADVPNEPENNGTNFIFVHGYNVNVNQARGWQAAMFKRMFWSGSHARYYGVTWDGYESQQNLLGFIQFTPNYQTNVVNAFLTAPSLASFLNGLSGTNIVAGHSLGNMLVLSALSDWNANIQDYFMIDAAVPSEAIDTGASLSTNMDYPDWLPYATRLWASDWHQLWTNDNRGTLTWNNRLGNFGNAQVYNFYSSGEEVLRTWSGGSPPSSFMGVILSQILASLRGQVGYHTWSWQEIMKGRMSSSWGNSMLSSDHGGWKFNAAYSSLTPAQAALLTNSTLQTNSFFNFVSSDFTNDSALYGSGGSAYAQSQRNRILSDAIPAVTLPIGANSVTNLDEPGVTHNFDMQALYENGWPSSRPTRLVGASAPGEWHHSDIRVVSYTYTHGLFDKLVDTGNLK